MSSDPNSTSSLILEFGAASDSENTVESTFFYVQFSSYSFERNMLTPASAFRFTAPGLPKNLREDVRSGDLVILSAVDPTGKKFQLAAGFIDETDTHITSANLEYTLTGRDTLGQLIDNASVDENNAIVNVQNINLATFVTRYILPNTRMPISFVNNNNSIPNGPLNVTTNPGETKIDALLRYLDFLNCLVWTNAQGQMVLGKPNFAQPISGVLQLSSSNPIGNNVIEARVRRNTNQAIRLMVTQLQTQGQVNPTPYTYQNNDVDVLPLIPALIGRSVYNVFSYGDGEDLVNLVTAIGNQSGNPYTIGAALSRREIARENIKVLEVEIVVQGHFNSEGYPYNIDQIYKVIVDDDNVSEDMYVYTCSYELTMEHGTLTRLTLCRLGAIVDGGSAFPNASNIQGSLA